MRTRHTRAPSAGAALATVVVVIVQMGCSKSGRQVGSSDAVVRAPQAQPSEVRPEPRPAAAREPSNFRTPWSVPRHWPSEAAPVPSSDAGIFEELAARVRVRHPSWLEAGPANLLEFAGHRRRFVLVDGEPVAFAVGGEGPVVAATRVGDADEDGIPDALDVLIGAKKTVLNGAYYKSSYRSLDYPMGDVPRGEGVCTDVIVRALRNAGYDLQHLVADDIASRARRYSHVLKPDRNIDHRRVRTLLPYFQQYWRALPALASAAPLLPGDVLFMDTLHGPEPEHMGIVSDRVGRSGLPLIVNNWNDGTRTSEMDLLSFVPVTHRFRAPGRLQVRSEARGLGGLLARRGLTLAGAHRQLVLVTVATWKQSAGVLRRYERQARGGWEPVGEPVQVRVGRRGLGRGRGLHGPEALGDLSSKREGDRKAPAGLFALGTAFGPEPSAPYRGRWPWRAVGSRDRFVDDAASAVYNTWQRAPESGAPAWASAEELAMYELGLVVEHNPEPVQAGAGSAIFIHTWKDPATATLGCTALARDELQALLDWLEPAADPVLVQVAGALL